MPYSPHPKHHSDYPRKLHSSKLPSDGPYVSTTHTFTCSNLNSTFKILALTHTKSTIALYHKSLIRIANLSIPLSFLSTPTQTHFTPHHSFSPFPSIFVSVTACKSNLSFLNTSITSLLNNYSFDIPCIHKIHTFSPKDRTPMTAITTFSEPFISIPGKR